MAGRVDRERWLQEQAMISAKVSGWVAANLQRQKRIPDLQSFLDPPRTKRLTPSEAEEHRAAFEAMKAASDRVPVRPQTVKP